MSASILLEGVEYREVPGWPGYGVSELGRVAGWRKRGTRNHVSEMRPQSWRLLKFEVTRGGYYRVTLCGDKGKKRYPVHQLVLMCWVGPRPEGAVACHADGRKTNNAASNLRWGTPADNAADTVRLGEVAGERNGHSKLTEIAVKEIRRLLSVGWSAGAIATRYAVTPGVIHNIKHRKSWGHVL